MKVSIITVTRNSEKTIEDTLVSVLQQDWPDVEHIIIDGTSTDGTMEVVNKYRKNIAKVISEPDAGIYDAMNKGIRLASGDVIGLLNSDDMYTDRSAIRTMMGGFEDKQTEVVYADLVYVKPEQTGKVVRRFSSAGFNASQLAFGMAPAHPTLFLKKSIFDRYGFYKTDYQISADFEFMARLFHDSSLHSVYVPQVIIKMRLGGISTRGFRSLLLSNSEMLRACRENGIESSIFKILLKYPRKMRGYF